MHSGSGVSGFKRRPLGIALLVLGSVALGTGSFWNASVDARAKKLPIVVPTTMALGRRPFSTTSPWNSRVPRDATYESVPEFEGDNGWVNYDKYSIPVFRVVRKGGVLVTITAEASWDAPARSFRFRIDSPLKPAEGTDKHVHILDDVGGFGYDFWLVEPTQNGFSAKAYGIASLNGPGAGARIDGKAKTAGVRAAGSSTLAGLLTYRDFQGATIDHTLAAANSGAEFAPVAVPPAIAFDNSAPKVYQGRLPMGSRFAIPRDAVRPEGLSIQGNKVFTALQEYGLYLVDGADSGLLIYAESRQNDSEDVEDIRRDLPRLVPLLRLLPP